MTTQYERIERFIAQPTIAVIGVSRSGKKFGNVASRELRAHGYRVFVIHPDADSIDGAPCYRSCRNLPERVQAALVVVPPARAIDAIRDAAGAGIRQVWLQQGAESPEVLRMCDQLKLETIAGECILMFAQPTGFHRAHRWLRGLCRMLPQAQRA